MPSPEFSVVQGITVGAVGGALAGLTVWLADLLREKYLEHVHKKRVYDWLSKNSDQADRPFRSTRAIASHNNLTQDRVRYICSRHESIFLSTGEREDMWSVYGIGPREQD
jgi:hypothetical protein